MKVQELRIGNYVIDNLEICQVIQIESNGNVMTTCKSKFPISHINELQSVELTEDLLLKCGFESKYFGIKTFYNPLMELDHDFYLMGVDYGVKIKHLHQLQNLYFVLTGKELEIKLPLL